MNQEARENATAALRETIRDKDVMRDEIEEKLVDAALELNYHKGSSEEALEINGFIQTKEEELRILDQEIQGLKDQLHSIATVLGEEDPHD